MWARLPGAWVMRALAWRRKSYSHVRYRDKCTHLYLLIVHFLSGIIIFPSFSAYASFTPSPAPVLVCYENTPHLSNNHFSVTFFHISRLIHHHGNLCRVIAAAAATTTTATAAAAVISAAATTTSTTSRKMMMTRKQNLHDNTHDSRMWRWRKMFNAENVAGGVFFFFCQRDGKNFLFSFSFFSFFPFF